MKKIALVLALSVAAMGTGCASLKEAASKIKLDDVKKLLQAAQTAKNPNGPFKVMKSVSQEPKIVIDNQTDYLITVVAKGAVEKKMVAGPKQTAEANVVAGKYHLTASVPGATPYECDATLKKFNDYRWIFSLGK